HPDEIDRFGHLLTEVGGRERRKPSGTGATGASGTRRELLRGLLEPRKGKGEPAGSLHSRERITEEQDPPAPPPPTRAPGKTVTSKFRVQHALGYWLCLEAIGDNLLANPRVGGIMVTCRDISERWVLEEQLAHQAFHDPLTNLPNKALFMDRLAHALARAGRKAGTHLVAVLALDLDNFKFVNDTLGHRTGDRLLSLVAERIRAAAREGDTVARMGGDEFSILLEDVGNIGDTTILAERVEERLQAPFDLEGRNIFVTASVGIAAGSSSADRADDMLSNADPAMYYAKNNRETRYAIFEPSMNSYAWKRLEMEAELRAAIERR